MWPNESSAYEMSPTIQRKEADFASVATRSYTGFAVQLLTKPPTGSIAPRIVLFSKPQSPKIMAVNGSASPLAMGAEKVTGTEPPHEYE